MILWKILPQPSPAQLPSEAMTKHTWEGILYGLTFLLLFAAELAVIGWAIEQIGRLMGR